MPDQKIVCDGCGQNTASTVPYKFGHYCYRCMKFINKQLENQQHDK